MKPIFCIAIVSLFFACRAGAQSHPRGVKEDYINVRGNEAGPVLRGEFGVHESFYHFRRWNGGVYLPALFSITSADTTRGFVDTLIVVAVPGYSMRLKIDITDNRGNVVAAPRSQAEDEQGNNCEIVINALPPGRYSVNFYGNAHNEDDPLIHSVLFRKLPVENK